MMECCMLERMYLPCIRAACLMGFLDMGMSTGLLEGSTAHLAFVEVHLPEGIWSITSPQMLLFFVSHPNSSWVAFRAAPVPPYCPRSIAASQSGVFLVLEGTLTSKLKFTYFLPRFFWRLVDFAWNFHFYNQPKQDFLNQGGLHSSRRIVNHSSLREELWFMFSFILNSFRDKRAGS